MLGPDFHSPKPPETTHFTENPQPVKTVSTPSIGKAGNSQQFVVGQSVPAEWWELFQSPQINELIRKGLANSPNLQAAKATLVQAQETYNAQFGASMYPSVAGQFTGKRQRFSGAMFGASTSNIFNVFNASVNVSYTLDFFGALRRELEALKAQVDYNQYLLDAAYLTLTSNIVTTAITMASAQAQIEATKEIIGFQDNQLRIARRQLELGGISGIDVLSQQTQLAQVRASLPPLQQQLAQAKHALSVLIGEMPSEGDIPDIRLDKLNLPHRLPISISSEFVQQRPDIRASEALLHAANAQVGVAIANMYPQLTISASDGWTNTTLSHLVGPSNRIWSMAGGLLQPIFNGGQLTAKKRGAIAGFELAAAQYRQTVLVAFQNVADTLRALENDAKTLHEQRESEIAAQQSYRIAQKQLKLGSVSYLYLLTAEQQYQQARIGRIQAEAARFNDTAALFQALGGGWWKRKI